MLEHSHHDADPKLNGCASRYAILTRVKPEIHNLWKDRDWDRSVAVCWPPPPSQIISIGFSSGDFGSQVRPPVLVRT